MQKGIRITFPVKKKNKPDTYRTMAYYEEQGKYRAINGLGSIDNCRFVGNKDFHCYRNGSFSEYHCGFN